MGCGLQDIEKEHKNHYCHLCDNKGFLGSDAENRPCINCLTIGNCNFINDIQTSMDLIYKKQIEHIPIIKRLLREFGPCDNCGRCCKNERVTTTKDELEPIQKWNPQLFKDSTFKDFGRLISLKRPCPYHKDNRCTVYNKRPTVCAIFPFIFSYGGLAIVYCDFGERIINEIFVYCKKEGILVQENQDSQVRLPVSNYLDTVMMKWV